MRAGLGTKGVKAHREKKKKKTTSLPSSNTLSTVSENTQLTQYPLLKRNKCGTPSSPFPISHSHLLPAVLTSLGRRSPYVTMRVLAARSRRTSSGKFILRLIEGASNASGNHQSPQARNGQKTRPVLMVFEVGSRVLGCTKESRVWCIPPG